MATDNISSDRFSRLKSLLGDWKFLKKNLGLLFFWPIKSFILALIGWHLLITHLDAEKIEAEKMALREAETLSRAYAQHLYRALEAVDQITLYVKSGWELGGTNFKLEKMANTGLFAESAGFYVSIIDANGNLRSSTIPEARRVNIATEPYFEAQLDGRDELYIGTARIGNFSRTPVVPFSRRLEDAKGNFQTNSL